MLCQSKKIIKLLDDGGSLGAWNNQVALRDLSARRFAADSSSAISAGVAVEAVAGADAFGLLGGVGGGLNFGDGGGDGLGVEGWEAFGTGRVGLGGVLPGGCFGGGRTLLCFSLCF